MYIYYIYRLYLIEIRAIYCVSETLIFDYMYGANAFGPIPKQRRFINEKNLQSIRSPLQGRRIKNMPSLLRTQYARSLPFCRFAVYFIAFQFREPLSNVSGDILSFRYFAFVKFSVGELSFAYCEFWRISCGVEDFVCVCVCYIAAVAELRILMGFGKYTLNVFT